VSLFCDVVHLKIYLKIYRRQLQLQHDCRVVMGKLVMPDRFEWRFREFVMMYFIDYTVR